MSIAAHELGLGACWVGAFNEEKVREILNLPDNLIPVVICALLFRGRWLPRLKTWHGGP
jgi:nitroreductase